jgi:hypothetical protein
VQAGVGVAIGCSLAAPCRPLSGERRIQRNPGTGETIEIAAARKMTFAPAKALKDMLKV